MDHYSQTLKHSNQLDRIRIFLKKNHGLIIYNNE
jgi:hypothetical protein